jgi:formylglycine-generating enzyme required for sulfatase activity
MGVGHSDPESSRLYSMCLLLRNGDDYEELEISLGRKTGERFVLQKLEHRTGDEVLRRWERHGNDWRRSRNANLQNSPGEKPGPDVITDSIGSRSRNASLQNSSGEKPGPDVITNSIGMKLKLIKPGDFLMGSPSSLNTSEMPQHRVRITRPFYLGVYEVTQAEYQRVMGTNPSRFSEGGNQADRVSGKDTARHPVENVTWDEAVEFCRKLSSLQEERSAGWKYGLPTEAEWEYACRAGTTTEWHCGDDMSQVGRYAWYRGVSDGRTHPVGQKQANPWGLYDMHGNVFEWCEDRYDEDYYRSSPTDDPLGPKTGWRRVHRGGSWDRDPPRCRSANRYSREPAFRSDQLGFRVVRVPSGK